MTTDETRSIVAKAILLNVERRYLEAIELIQQNLQDFDPHLRYNGLKEVFNAAIALGDKALAKRSAQEIAKEHPDLPSIQDYL